jgi:photosystem II stability/assembly factor-like uncharacterized protein
VRLISTGFVLFRLIASLSAGTSLAQSGWFVQHQLPRRDALNAVVTLDDHTAVAVGQNGRDGGVILRTIDGGLTWTVQSIGLAYYLYGIAFPDPQTAVTVGGDQGTLGAILRSTDGGITWTRLEQQFPRLMLGVSFIDANNGVAVGYGGIFRTSDGGATWIQTDPTVVESVSFSGATGVAVDYSSIVRSTDGGLTWSQVFNPTSNPLWQVSMGDQDTGTIVGNSGTVLRTTDGGATWSAQRSGTDSNLRGI